MSRKLLVLLLAGVVAVAFIPANASAHALIRSSVPAAGGRVEQAPEEVSITFTEAPEPSFSSIEVVDSSGRSVIKGKAQAVPGMPLTLRVDLDQLSRGVFTVSWRAFSRVDGHTTAGNFAFGVGVSPASAPAETEIAARPSVSSEELVARWIFNIGIVVLLGTALISSLAFQRPPESTRRMLTAALVLALLGLAVLGDAQRKAAGAGWDQFLTVFIGRAVVWRAAGLLPAAVLVLMPGRLGRRKLPLLLAAAGVAATMVIHAASGHAAASHAVPWAQITFQSVHLLVVGVWIGGLAALIAGIRGEPDEVKARAVKRFSLAAGVALFIVAVTGVLRAVDSLGKWSDLVSTPYGITVSIKGCLWVALAALGGLNRFRNVPVAGQRLRGLRAVSRVELGLAVIVIGAAAMLASTPPSAFTGERGPARRVTASGSDFATSIRAKLEISPGTAGPNRFVLTLRDYDSGEPIRATKVILRFSNIDDPGLGESTLALDRREPGSYQASGPNLSMPGRWRVVAVVQERADSAEIPLLIATSCDTTASEVEGQPTVYTNELPGGSSAQGYLDPGKEGLNDVHLTFFDSQGAERPVEGATIYAATPSGPRMTLQSRRLGPGHFVADADLRPGRWRFDFRSEGGSQPLVGCFETRLER
jgi:copper transport protein